MFTQHDIFFSIYFKSHIIDWAAFIIVYTKKKTSFILLLLLILQENVNVFFNCF